MKPKGKERLKYAVLITYTDTYNIDRVYEWVKAEWKEARWPLLLILVDVVDVSRRKIFSGREFQNIQMSIFSGGEEVKYKELWSAKAFPWEVAGTRWSYEL